MIKKILMLMLISSVMAMPAFAADKKIEVVFEYPGQAKEFRLYMDGTKICSTTNGSARTMECSTVPIGYGVHLFTLTAIQLDGIETLHSPAYSWAYSPIQGDGPTMMEISVTLENGTVVPIGQIALKQP